MNERTTSCVPLKIKYSSPLQTRPAEALRLAAARAPGDGAAATHIGGAATFHRKKKRQHCCLDNF